MSTHIKMDENYQTITKYHGILDGKFHFTVDHKYDSYTKTYEIESIDFDPIKKEENMPTEYWDKSKKRIKDFVDKWLFENVWDKNITYTFDEFIGYGDDKGKSED